MANRKLHERAWRGPQRRRTEQCAENHGTSPYLAHRHYPRVAKLFARRAQRHAWCQALRVAVATFVYRKPTKHPTRYE